MKETQPGGNEVPFNQEFVDNDNIDNLTRGANHAFEHGNIGLSAKLVKSLGTHNFNETALLRDTLAVLYEGQTQVDFGDDYLPEVIDKLVQGLIEIRKRDNNVRHFVGTTSRESQFRNGVTFLSNQSVNGYEFENPAALESIIDKFDTSSVESDTKNLRNLIGLEEPKASKLTSLLRKIREASSM